MYNQKLRINKDKLESLKVVDWDRLDMCGGPKAL